MVRISDGICVRLLVWLALFSSIGCSTRFYRNFHGREIYRHRRPMTWAFSCDFPSDVQLRDDVRYGFIWWNGLLHDDRPATRLFAEVGSCTRRTDLTVFLTLTRSGDQVALATVKTLGDEIRSAEVIYRATWFYKTRWERRNVAVHETGHVLGLQHVDDDTCVMYPVMTYHDRGHRRPCSREFDEFIRNYGRR